MAARANLLSNVAGIYRRSRVGVSLDLVLAMAIGTNRRVGIPLSQSRRMHTAVKLRSDLLVTFGAGAWLVLFIDFCASHDRAIHLVRTVTIDAVG